MACLVAEYPVPLHAGDRERQHEGHRPEDPTQGEPAIDRVFLRHAIHSSSES